MGYKIFRFLIFLIVSNVNCKEFTLHDSSVVKDADKIFAKLQQFSGDSEFLVFLVATCNAIINYKPSKKKTFELILNFEKIYEKYDFKIRKRGVQKVILNAIVIDNEKDPIGSTKAILINPFKP